MKQSNFETYINSTNVRFLSPTSKFFNNMLILGQWLYPKGAENLVRKKFFTPITKPLFAAQNYWIEKASSVQVASRGNKIQLWKLGDGPTLLFIHGWNGRGAQFQHFFQPSLDAGFSILFFDAPAHGLSEGEMTNYLEITESIQNIFQS